MNVKAPISYDAGKIVNSLRIAKDHLGNSPRNPFVKMMPTFVKWVEEGRVDSILQYAKKRFDIYLETGFYKRGLGSDQKSPEWFTIHEKLQAAKTLLTSRDGMEANERDQALNFLAGYFHDIDTKGVSLDWVESASFLGPEEKLACLLGSFIKDIAILQINHLNNKGLVKKLMAFMKMASINEMKRAYITSSITLFRLMLKNVSSIPQYVFTRMAMLAKQLMEMNPSKKINTDLVKVGILAGLMANTSVETAVTRRKERHEKRDADRKRRLLLPRSRVNEMCTELGFLFHVFSREELNSFKSRRYTRVAPNSRNLNAIKICRLYNYVGTMAARYFIKNALTHVAEEGNEFYMKYPYQNVFMSLSEYVISMEAGDILPSQASMAFAIGYHDYWYKKQEKGGNNK